jgi:trans-aconitate methyltransferase
MKFSADAYWTRRVPNPESMMPFSPIRPAHAAQERALKSVLAGLEFDSALEVGCGLGRITAMLGTDDLTAIDIGADQVVVTRQRVPSAVVEQARIQDYEPDRQWDLVLASEVLMHIPPDDIQAVVDKLQRLSRRWVVTLDWTEPITRRVLPHTWLHDYRSLFGKVETVVPIGLQSIFVVHAA